MKLEKLLNIVFVLVIVALAVLLFFSGNGFFSVTDDENREKMVEMISIEDFVENGDIGDNSEKSEMRASATTYKDDIEVVSDEGEYRGGQEDPPQPPLSGGSSGFKILFFGDLIFDRGVYRNLSGFDLIKDHFSYRYTQDVYDGEYKTFDQISKEYDFVGFNLETPIAKEWVKDSDGNSYIQNDCQRTDKTIAFCSHEMILPVMRKMGFNTLNIMNNHAMDGGINGHLSTIDSLEKYNFNYFGNVKHGKYFNKNYVFTGEKDGNLFAWHGFDIVIYKSLHLKNFCKELEGFETRGYTNFVSIHWGREYDSLHSDWQEKVGRYMIDCGADLIIGHHPHVIQDIGWYQGKPIIYSLGNFLFDQSHREETQIGGYVIIHYPFSGDVKLFTGEVDAYGG